MADFHMLVCHLSLYEFSDAKYKKKYIWLSMWDVLSLVILTTLIVSFFLSEMHIALLGSSRGKKFKTEHLQPQLAKFVTFISDENKFWSSSLGNHNLEVKG